MLRKKLNQGLWPILVLTVVCVVCTGLLALTNQLTLPARNAQVEAAAMASKQKLFPNAKGFSKEAVPPAFAEHITSVEKVEDADGSFGGYLFLAHAKGYAGQVPAYVAIDAKGHIVGLDLPANDETPGLGQKVREPQFYSQFNNDDPKLRFYDRKSSITDPNKYEWHEIDGVSAATFSSQAVCDAVNAARNLFDVLTEGGH